MRGYADPQTDDLLGKWYGLGKDVRGLCNTCHLSRELVAQYLPTDQWVCQECFRKVFTEEPQ